MTNEIDYKGALLDERPQELKDKDFKSDNPELASALPINWIEKTPEQWKNYPARDQSHSSSCVAQALSKALFTMNIDIYSAHPIYRSRKNFSDKGMWLYDGADILKKQGTVLENIDISQGIGESEMNKSISDSVQNILKTNAIKVGGYVYVDKNDFEGIAKAVEDNKHCVITVGSNYNEWSSIPQVQGEVKWGHAICVIDYVLYQGKKYLVIEDSWGSNIGQFDDRRLLSEEFIKARCTGAMYLLPYVPSTPIHHVFTQTLKKGDNNNEVLMLQNKLKELGFFPNMSTTTYFGTITENAVKKFQLAYKNEILVPAGLTQPTGVFGKFTLTQLNKLI